MKYEAVVANPDSVNVTLTLTMPLGDWKLIYQDSTAVSVPTCQFRNIIRNLIEQMSEKVKTTTGGQ